MLQPEMASSVVATAQWGRSFEDAWVDSARQGLQELLTAMI